MVASFKIVPELVGVLQNFEALSNHLLVEKIYIIVAEII